MLSLCFAPAQTTDILQNKIEDWEAAGQNDSIDHYYPQLALAYRSDDQLADFFYSYWDWQSYWFDNSAKALAILDTALNRQWRPPANAGEGEALLWIQINRGYHLGELGRILPSTQAYEAALQYYTQYDFNFFDAVDYLFIPLGAHYTRLGDNEKARGIYLRAIPIAETHVDAESLAGLYNNLGLTYWNAGQYESAIETFQSGLALAGVSNLRTGLLKLSTAQSFFDQGDEVQTGKYLVLADRYLRLSDSSEARMDYLSGVRKLQGDLCTRRGKYAKANLYYAEALQFARQVYGQRASRDIGKIHLSRGRLLMQQQQFNEALTTFNEAISSVLPGFQPGAARENPRPEQLYEENTLLDALAGKAETYRQMYLENKEAGHLASALSCFELAYQVEAGLRGSFQYESSKLLLLADSRRRTEKALWAILELYQRSPGEEWGYQALAWMERAKAVILLEAIQRNLARNAIQTEDTLLQKEQTLNQRRAFFERQLILAPDSDQRAEWQREKFKLEQELNQIGNRLAERYPRLQNFRNQKIEFDRLAFRRVLLPQPENHYLSYFAGERHLYGLMISNDAIRFTRLGSADSLQREVLGFLEQLTDAGKTEDLAQYQQQARQVAIRLLEPLLPSLGATPARLCISPDAWLSFLPFEALVEPHSSASARSWQQVDFLLWRHPVQYTYSVSIALWQKQAKESARRNARLIAPLFPAGERNLAPLPGSREELAAIAPVCSDRLVAAAATRHEVLARISDFRILHFSTHAQADSAGRGSRIELYDQPLYLPDIYALRLRADLVVLSACESGIGQLEKGEGVMSLARAFTYAGASGLVSSLWSVNARATTTVMKEFYRQLWNRKPVGQALDQAKQAYLESEAVAGLYKSPYYWAGFVYIGPPDVSINVRPTLGCRPIHVYLTAFFLVIVLMALGYWAISRKS